MRRLDQRRGGDWAVLDQEFGADTLHVLREAVLAQAAAAGLPGDRAIDVMITVHELAANAVRHGAGAGRVRMLVDGGALHCQVIDAGPRRGNGQDGRGSDGTAGPWPTEMGHGLWLVRKAADRVRVSSGPGGSQVNVLFALPAVPVADPPGDDSAR
jgi:anti-sigma regulatory factor (Ser/Thr protein kinase)